MSRKKRVFSAVEESDGGSSKSGFAGRTKQRSGQFSLVYEDPSVSGSRLKLDVGAEFSWTRQDDADKSAVLVPAVYVGGAF